MENELIEELCDCAVPSLEFWGINRAIRCGLCGRLPRELNYEWQQQQAKDSKAYERLDEQEL